MMDHRKLRDFPIPEMRQTYSSRDAQFYALSVGLGQDPLSEAELRFVDETRGPLVLPSLCVVLGHPGFWISDPATTVNALKLVHAEEAFEILRPLSATATVIGRTRITDLVDKGEGRGALLYTEKELIDAADGIVIARVLRTTMLRGDGGYGGHSGAPRATPMEPSGPPDIVIERAVRPEQALLYRLNGDPNPLHIDPATARAAGFAHPILHGLCTFGMATAQIVLALASGDPSRLRGFRARFSAPVYPGETLRFDIWTSGALRATAVERGVAVLTHAQATFG